MNLPDNTSEEIRNILLSPMKSEISTSDIVTGMWSSTNLGEKVAAINTLITNRENAARVDELKYIYNYDGSEDFEDRPYIWDGENVTYIDDRIKELSSKPLEEDK